MASGLGASTPTQPRSHGGCCLQDDEFETLSFDPNGLQRFESGAESFFTHSRNPSFDRALAGVLSSMSKVFNVLPAFVYYDDSRSGPNAYANDTERMKRTDGTVAFGLQFLQQKLQRRPDGSHVAAVCAHEFGHIVQLQRGIDLSSGQPTIKRQELHADFLAGYFAARHKEDRPSYPAAEFALAQQDGGDPATWDRSHHGTPQERGSAVVAGFNARKVDGLNLDDAVDGGVRYVRGT